MSLSDISIKNPVFAWMLMIAMILFGFLAYREMGVSQLPDVDMPMVNVSISWSGASPEVVESDVVDVIESALMGVEGVESISSSVRRGGANVSVEFSLDRNIDSALTVKYLEP
jgi:HAE1 family hydrophobic/amphiphilic exporter-1